MWSFTGKIKKYCARIWLLSYHLSVYIYLCTHICCFYVYILCIYSTYTQYTLYIYYCVYILILNIHTYICVCVYIYIYIYIYIFQRQEWKCQEMHIYIHTLHSNQDLVFLTFWLSWILWRFTGSSEVREVHLMQKVKWKNTLFPR